MQAVLLVGGKGTRVSDLYPDRPKGLIPICGRPFLDWQIEWLASKGVTDVHLAAGYKAEQIESWAAQATDHGVSITLSEEPKPLGTGGGLKFVETFITREPFLCLNGDSLLPHLDLKGLLEAHAASSATTFIAVTEIRSAGRFGTVEFTDEGIITAFKEKAERDAGWVNAGVYMMMKAALADVQPDSKVSMETDIFPSLVSRGDLRAFQTEPPLLDMGTAEGISEMEAYLKATR